MGKIVMAFLTHGV